MATFNEILCSSDAGLVKAFYRIPPSTERDFIKRINHAASHVGLNHTQLVCALGFNRNIRELTDVLSVIGFSSWKLLSYRRDELFVNDAYRQLPVDDIVDIYSEYLEDPDILSTLRELVPRRLQQIERSLAAIDDTSLLVSYKMELHSIYAGGIATPEFAQSRVEQAYGHLRAMIKEVPMIIEFGLIPPGNLFFSDDLLPIEKRQLIEAGHIDHAMVRNRLQNTEISEDERQMLEDFV